MTEIIDVLEGIVAQAQKAIDAEKTKPLSVAESAEILHITEDGVHALIRRGRIQATKVKGRWLVDRESVEQRARDRKVRR